MKQTAYKFDSKHLAKAFMDELLDMGYHGGHCSPEGCNYILDNFALLGKKRVDYNQESLGNGKEFQLETQWSEALEFAKREIEADKEPEFKEGDWVVCEMPLMKKWAGKNKRTYGFDWGGNWSDDLGMRTDPTRKASPKEIEQALRKEWSKRCKEAGWDDPDVAEIKAHADGHGGHTNRGDYALAYDPDEMWTKMGQVYCEGKWATPKKKKANKFLGYDVDYLNNKVEIGCHSRDKDYLRKMVNDLRIIEKESSFISVSELIEELEGLDLSTKYSLNISGIITVTS